MNWLKDGLSLDETRVSALILAFFATLVIAFYQVFVFGDISANLLMLLAYELAAFTGIKVAEQFAPKQLQPYEREDNSNDTPMLP